MLVEQPCSELGWDVLPSKAAPAPGVSSLDSLLPGAVEGLQKLLFLSEMLLLFAAVHFFPAAFLALGELGDLCR